MTPKNKIKDLKLVKCSQIEMNRPSPSILEGTFLNDGWMGEFYIVVMKPKC